MGRIKRQREVRRAINAISEYTRFAIVYSNQDGNEWIVECNVHDDDLEIMEMKDAFLRKMQLETADVEGG